MPGRNQMNSTEPIISVSGMRGVLGSSLTPERIVRYVAAFASSMPRGTVVVTRDGRTSGTMVAQVVQATLQAAGLTVLDGGISATPTTGRLVRQYQCQGGIQVSASHNPPEYNGLKLFRHDGRVIPATEGEIVLRKYRDPNYDPEWCSYQQIGSWGKIEDTSRDHLQAILKLVDVGLIRKKNFRVLLDPNRASGSVLGLPLLHELGCEVVQVDCTPDGVFQHPPEPTEENLQSVLCLVRDAQACVGFCQDPDADRLALVDSDGVYIGEEYTLALCVDHVLSCGARGAIVTNCSTSSMSERLASKYGAPFYRSRVGEAHVADCMLHHNAIFGGEGNGGPIDPRVGLIRDSFVGIALVLDGLAKKQISLNSWVQSLPPSAMSKAKLEVPRELLPEAFSIVKRHFQDASIDEMDGLRCDWADRWVLLRASNTEPIIRVIAEGPTRTAADNLCDSVLSIMKRLN